MVIACRIRSCSGRKQCPSDVASDRVNCSPAFTRCGLSCGIPTACAMVSAVLNPIPHTSAANRYGSVRTTPIEASAYCLKIRTANDVDTPTPCRNTITSLIAFCSSHAAVINLVRFGPRFGTSTSRCGAVSITSSAATPKWSTMLSASFGPIPLINPDPRYRRTPCTVAGSTVVKSSTWNCRPYCGCDPHLPRSRSASPGRAPNSDPTTVINSPPRPVSTLATMYPVSSLA